MRNEVQLGALCHRLAFGAALLIGAIAFGSLTLLAGYVERSADEAGRRRILSALVLSVVSWGLAVVLAKRRPPQESRVSRAASSVLVYGTILLAYVNVFARPDMRVRASLLAPLLAAILLRARAWTAPESALDRLLASCAAFPARKLVLGLTVSAILVLILELTGRLLGLSSIEHSTIGGDRFGLELAPYVMFAEPGCRHRDPSECNASCVNAQGFLGRAFERTKGADEMRLAIVGGSVVYQGGGYDSIATELEKLLQSRSPRRRWRVANFGRQSYNSMQELILVERNVLPLEVDAIIVFDGFNDFWNVRRESPGRPYLYSALEDRVHVTGSRAILGELVGALGDRSVIVSELRRRLERGTPGRDPASLADEVIAEYRRNVFELAKLAQAYGTKVLLAPQPYVGTKTRRTNEEEALVPSSDFLVAYRRLVEAARDAAARAGVLFSDTTDVFTDTDAQVYDDVVHIWEHGGNPIVARRLLSDLCRLGVIDGP